jgi:hypothetical protein
MRKATTFLTIAALLVLLLAACAPAPSQQGEVPQGAEQPMPGAEQPLPGAGEPMVTPEQGEMTTPAPEETVVSEPPAAETAPVEPVETTGAITETGVIPPTGSMDPGRVSNLLGAAVASQDGEQIGAVDDFIVDLSTGSITYVVVAASAAESGENMLVPIPIALLTWDAATSTLQLALDKQTVLAAPYFEGGEYPDTQEMGWDATYSDYWATAIPGG